MLVDGMMAITRTVAMINSDQKTAPPLPDPEGVDTRLYDLRLRVFARTPYEHLFTELGTVEAAERALHDGCDAIYIDSFGDYGVERIRAMTDVPVIGAGEAALAAAGAEGRRFSIVTVWPESMRYLYEDRVSTCAGGKGCIGVHHLGDETELDLIGSDLGVKARMTDGDHEVVAELAALCARVVKQDRPDVILLGCTCMAPVHERLAAHCEVPVLEPSQLGLTAAFAAIAGAETVARTQRIRPPLASSVVDAYLTARGVEKLSVGGCEICVVPQD
jgi:allantoin racemase